MIQQQEREPEGIRCYKDVEKNKLVTVGENVYRYSHYGKPNGYFSKSQDWKYHMTNP